jgi:hypothetical protein
VRKIFFQEKNRFFDALIIRCRPFGHFAFLMLMIITQRWGRDNPFLAFQRIYIYPYNLQLLFKMAGRFSPREREEREDVKNKKDRDKIKALKLSLRPSRPRGYKVWFRLERLMRDD